MTEPKRLYIELVDRIEFYEYVFVWFGVEKLRLADLPAIPLPEAT